ncbi:NAD(P)/FAD-dependent oxidoreductase [Paracoccus sp. p4-l81]|uniref:NAD(P)/FAD-dependent oxidoreductase n=1 Tax=Paracoccus sp. p4-l81 TaxID=3342806 RepID=UPI0035BA2828
MRFDVVVIGGAVMGAATAFFLTRMQPGLRVAVIERDPSFARAATALSVASIRSQFSTPVNVAISRFGIDFIRDFGSWTGQVGDLGLRENGYLFLTASAQRADLMEDHAAMQRSLGAATEVLSPTEIAARWPWLSVEGLVAGSFGPRDEGWFDNMGLLNGLRAAARGQGAMMLTGQVTGFDRQGQRLIAARLEDGQRIEGEVFVNCAGTRAADLMADLGAPIPVEPRKRTVFVIDAPGARHPDAPLLIDPGGFYLRPEGQQWITATVPEGDGPVSPEDFTPEADQFEAQIWPRLWERAPGFEAVRVKRFWTGQYDYNLLDQNAILGRDPRLDNLFIANGFSGHGLQQSPAVGRGLAELILTGGWVSLDLQDLSVDRVLANRPLREVGVV